MEQKSSSYHIDKNVILILLLTMFGASAVLGVKAYNHKPCEVLNFEIDAQQYRVGEIIRFKDFTENVTERQWSFGDTTELRYTENPFHTYSAPGKYLVELLVNGKCSAEKEIVIKEKLAIIDSTRLAKFEVPNSIRVGELLTATDFTEKATSWEWRFGETSEVNSTFQNPTYAYQTEGLKTVTLIVNGDPRYSTQKIINVLPAEKAPEPVINSTKSIVKANRERESLIKYDPTINNKPAIANAPPTAPDPVPEPVVEEPKKEPKKPKKEETPQISRTAFAKQVIKVSESQATANDFKPYMCGNLQVTTMARGKKTTFIEFCEKIKDKKIKIKSLELFKNEKTKCIEYISIDYSKGVF